MDDVLISFGGEIKSLGGGRFGGYLVRFTDASRRDLAGDYFTKETDFGIQSGAPTPVYFNHRLPLPTRDGKEIVVKARIGEGTLTIDDEGVLIDAIVYNREKYEKAIVEAGSKKRLGWSSGTAAHLIDRDEDGHIKTWPLGLDSSLTPIPCEPQNCAIPAKSYAALKFQPVELADEVEAPPPPFKGTLAAKLSQHVEDLTDDGHDRESVIGTMAAEAGMSVDAVKSVLAGDARPTDANLKAFARALRVELEPLKAVVRRDYAQSVRGMFDAMLGGRDIKRGDIEAASLTVISRLASAASTANVAGVTFDLKAKLDEVADVAAGYYKSHSFSEVRAYVESGSEEPCHLKSHLSDLSVTEGLDLDDHSRLAVSALKGIAARFRSNHEARVKSGRVLSEKNRQRISERLKEIQTVMDDLSALLEESQPMASDAEKCAAQSAFLRLQRRAHELGVN